MRNGNLYFKYTDKIHFACVRNRIGKEHTLLVCFLCGIGIVLFD